MAKPASVMSDWSVETTLSELTTVASQSTQNAVTDRLQELLNSGLDLDIRDSAGNTILHALTILSDDNPVDGNILMVFDALVDSSVLWWCKRNGLHYNKDKDDESYKHYKYLAIKYLTSEVYNKMEFSVVELSFKLANVQVVERLLMMEDVKCFRVENKIRYDADRLTPLTNEAVSQCCTNKVSPRPSLIEWLLGKKSLEKTADVLDLDPVRKFEDHYRKYTMLFYIMLMIVHTLYMIIFSYCGVALMEQKRNALLDASVARVLFYVVVPVEPACILLYAFYMLMRLILCRGEVKVMIKKRSVGFHYIGLFFLLLYVFVVGALIYQYSVGGENQNNLLSAALLYGWLITLPLTRGIKQINYLMKVLQSIILSDVYKILIIFTFVLLGFSLAIHVQFQVSSDIVAVFVDPMYTMFNMFNIVLGMGDLFPGNTESSLEASGGSALYCKIVYIMYLIATTIILLNLLIAMMNTSYSDILQQQTLTWRIESIQLGMELERNFMFLARCFPPRCLHYGSLNPNSSPSIGLSWYVELDDSRPKRPEKLRDIHSKIDMVSERLELLENSMVAELRRIEFMLKDRKK